MQGVDISPNMNYMKTYYSYYSPRFVGITDRDFLMHQDAWWDFPEPGMFTSYMKSVEDPRFPQLKNRIRATIHIMALVCKPDKNAQGEDITHCMLVTNIDINGTVPKWIVNFGAKNSPNIWFSDL
jgi:hypothetical protein